MYVNIGWEEYLNLNKVIGIFKKDGVDLNIKSKAKRIRYDKSIKTLILTEDLLYRIPIRSETIAKRINRENGGINGK